MSNLLRILLISFLCTSLICAEEKPAAAPPGAAPELKQEKEDPIPPAQPFYKGRKIAQTMHWSGSDWLTRNEREKEEGVSMLVGELQKKLKPGMAACDLGCGNGFYTLKLSKMVGETGKVYAVDIQPEMLEMLKKEAARQEAKNIVLVHNTYVSAKLPPASCDLILLVDVYHEFSHPEQMLKSIRDSLKPAGLVVLVEFRAEDDKVPIRPEHKMSKAQINKEWVPAGFKLAEQFDKLPWQHVMYFQRDDAPPKK